MVRGPVRTGVTVVLPRGHASPKPVNGCFFNLNGYGEMTSQSYLQDLGVVYGPIGISNINAIGQVYAGLRQWTALKFGEAVTPVVAETSDGGMNDYAGLRITRRYKNSTSRRRTAAFLAMSFGSSPDHLPRQFVLRKHSTFFEETLREYAREAAVP